MATREVPDWVLSGVTYEINPRAFSPTAKLRDITARLDDLVSLGVTILWLMPMHPTGIEARKGSLGSPYSIRDYYAIDPLHGGNADLRHLIEQAHAKGLKIILDIVANHTAHDSVLAAQHPEFFHRDEQGRILSADPDWSDTAWLDYSHRPLRRYMIDLLRYWIDFGFDGFRCDVAHYVPEDFWGEVRAELGDGVFLLAESESPALVAGPFDALYAWPFFKALNAVFTDGASATRIREVCEKRREELNGALELRFTENHDENRAITRLGDRAAQAAAVLVFTLDGIPLLYNGQEVGDTTESGPPALFERLPVYWDSGQRHPQLLTFYQQLIRLRRSHSALRQGELEWTLNSDAGRILSYLRRGNNQEFLVTINCSNRAFQGHVDGSPLPVALKPWGARVTERRWGRMLEI